MQQATFDATVRKASVVVGQDEDVAVADAIELWLVNFLYGR